MSVFCGSSRAVAGSLRSLSRWGLQRHREIQVRLHCNVKQLHFQWLDELKVFVLCFQEFMGQDEQVWAVSFARGFVWELFDLPVK